MFEVYVHEFELGGEKYRLVPATGDSIRLAFDVVEKLSGKEDGQVSADALDKLHKLALATFINSYPAEDKKKLEQFVTQHITKLVEPIMKVNGLTG
jgi:hypothetical protein